MLTIDELRTESQRCRRVAEAQSGWIEVDPATYAAVLDMAAEVAFLRQHNAALGATLQETESERDRLQRTIADANRDWAEDDTAIRNAARPILGSKVDGDRNGVPPMAEVVEWLAAEAVRLQSLADAQAKTIGTLRHRLHEAGLEVET